jgi:hypothetical protein
MGFAVDCDLIEKPEVAKRAVQLTGENRKEINGLLGAVVEPNLDSVWGNYFESEDATEQMRMRCYFSGSIASGFLPKLSSSRSARRSV